MECWGLGLNATYKALSIIFKSAYLFDYNLKLKLAYLDVSLFLYLDLGRIWLAAAPAAVGEIVY